MAVMHARFIVVLLLILAGLGISGPLRAQSLADVAKKEEERRKSVPKPAKVYTNKDLSALPAGAEPPPSGTAAQSLPDASRAATDAERAVKDIERKPDGPAKDRPTGPGA